jgi:inhibitor of cysteine peptidase
MKDDIEKILDECIDRMNGGESLEDCLAGYPDRAEELRPLLLAVRGLGTAKLPAINQKAKSAAKIRLNAALVQKREEVGVMKRLLGMFAFQKSKVFATVSVLLVAILVGVSVYAVIGEGGTMKPGHNVAGTAGVANFLSQKDFEAYLSSNSQSTQYTNSANQRGNSGAVGAGLGEAVPVPTSTGKTDYTLSAGSDTQRVSDTNVQVIGIDEPDIVKTDGMNIFFSREDYNYYYYESYSSDVMPPQTDNGIKIISANPPINMSVLSKIDKNGDLLLNDSTLAVFTWDGIYGYDVSDPQNPVSKWDITLNSSTSVVAARLYQGKIYLVTQTYVYSYEPLPIRPMEVNGKSVEVSYSDIYYPTTPSYTDSTLNVMVFDMQSGNLEDTVSFLDSSYSSVVYMSGDAIYVGYSYSEDQVPYIFDFCTKTCKGILPDSVIDKMNRLQTYDISNAAKMTEIGVIIDNYMNSLSGDEVTRVENDINNALQNYYSEHMRELEKTEIIKIGLDGLTVTANGSVPGSLLNQFSMDEYNGYLRLATTVSNGFGFSWFWASGGSVNDIYVLNGNLSIVGSVQDLGLAEQIYSARFVGDKGYLVTYQQTDPFYILDLSDPLHPQLKGELKIPGYSSYLHPISGDRMLGIGEENWSVKISLFDVADVTNPVELDKYVLNDSWSDILSTHHAFLLDEAHEIFFLPGSNSGYVFSYAGNNLELVKVVSDIQATRAIYIDDNLYVIGNDKIVVLNELDWHVVNEFKF